MIAVPVHRRRDLGEGLDGFREQILALYRKDEVRASGSILDQGLQASEHWAALHPCLRDLQRVADLASDSREEMPIVDNDDLHALALESPLDEPTHVTGLCRTDDTHACHRSATSGRPSARAGTSDKGEPGRDGGVDDGLRDVRSSAPKTKGAASQN